MANFEKNRIEPKMMMKLFLLSALCFFSFLLNAQVEREDVPPPANTLIKLHDRQVTGKVVDGRTGTALEAVSVQVYATFTDSGGRSRDSVVAGMFTRKNGGFSFTGLPRTGSMRVVVSGIGYGQKSIPVQVKGEAGVDLGNISIEPESRELAHVVISTSRPSLQMGIDRKVFSVEQNLTATGGTALDVMRNIPSVSVDVEGNVQLRNAQPQIFVDGRPTILTLDQIPADQIDRVELITNPSAKFDAASSGGIINVVMKRNRRLGLNGVATAGVGYPRIFNGNLTLNVRQGKLNFFTSAAYNQSGGRAKGETFRQNKSDGIIDNYFNQYSWTESRRRFSSVRFGLDFFATGRTTLSATQNIVGGRFTNDEDQDQEYLDAGRQLERYGIRRAEGRNGFNRYNTQLNLTHRFAEQGKELSASANYNYGNSDESSNITNSFFLPGGSPFSDPARVRNSGSNNNDQYTFQVDFTDPAGEDSKLEAGLRSFTNKQRSLFSSFSLENGSETLLPLGNNYAYTEHINAAYVSWSDALKSFSYQAGLRAEVSRFEGELVDSAKAFGYSYPRSAKRFFDALFPSLFLSKKPGENTELQLNYTRRIRRPNFWQLSPFIDINDPVNLRRGNPELQPEFTNSFEFNYSRDYAKGNFLGVVYYRNNRGDITRYSDTISASLYAQLNNAAIDPNAILNTFINARSTNSLGLELTLQHKFSDRFDIVPTVDMEYEKVNADAGELNLTNSGFNWEGKLTLNYKIPDKERGWLKSSGFQLTGEYESREVTAQGRNAPQYRADFAFRKDFLKNKRASLTFNVNDVFNTHRFGNIFDTETFYQESYRRRNVRTIRLTLTYKFGKDEFSLFRRNEDRNNSEDD
jgi:outer membrane receptor protein involved in Fe transport